MFRPEGVSDRLFKYIVVLVVLVFLGMFALRACEYIMLDRMVGHLDNIVQRSLQPTQEEERMKREVDAWLREQEENRRKHGY